MNYLDDNATDFHLRGGLMSLNEVVRGAVVVNLTGVNMVVKTKLARAISSIIALNVMMLPLQAQAQAPERIVVSGEKVGRTVDQTQTSIDVLTDEQLERASAVDMADVYKHVANVTQLSEGSNRTSFSIRGMNVFGEATSSSGSMTSSVYVDSASVGQLATRYGLPSMWDIAQVEFLRGPQSTIQGRNSMFGSVIINSNDPTYDTQGKVQLSVGSDHKRRISVAVSTPIIADELAIRIALDRDEADGYITNITRNEDDYAGYERGNARIKVLYEPAAIEDLSLLFSWNKANNQFKDSAMVPQELLKKYQAVSDYAAAFDIDADSASLAADYQINDQWSLTAVSGFSRGKFDRQDDYDSSAISGNTVVQHDNEQALSQEVRFFYQNENVSAIVGGFYAQVDLDTNYDILSIAPKELFASSIIGGAMYYGSMDEVQATDFYQNTFPNSLNIAAHNESTTSIANSAIFGEVDWRINDEWELVVGARLDHEKQSRTVYSKLSSPDTFTHPLVAGLVNGLTSEGMVDTPQKTTYNAFLPKLSAIYHLGEQQSVSANIQRSYRAGGISVNPLNGDVVTFDPEFAWNYELAHRASWLDGDLTSRTNIYLTQLTDQQVNVALDSTGLNNANINAGKSKLYGVELALNYNVSETLALYSNVGYAHTEFTEFAESVTINGTEKAITDLTGFEFRRAPAVNGMIGLEYDFAPGWYLNTDVSFRGDAWADSENTKKLANYTLVNAKVGYRSAHNWQVALTVKNLTDKLYVSNVFNQNSAIASIQDTYTVGAPRSVLLNMQYDF